MWNDSVEKRGVLVVISAPSGAGKSTIIKELLKRKPGEFKYSISATTRPIRGNEKNGKDYIFLDEFQFINQRNTGEFLEWAKVHGNYYATPKAPIFKAIANHETILLDIDVQGGIEVKKKMGDDALLIFVAPPSIQQLEKRLRNRKTDSEETILRRLKAVPMEMNMSDRYDAVVVNEFLDDTVERILQIIDEKQYDIIGNKER